eukprot:TRINITY_DN5170_c0_g1_i2.p1 TRINITY_DN5170_c0_g1~~TRINITY_DN5170_c0_g1_i2.p1  ORF type:complete len:586 (-),score=64.26 TRINITY_DN5170_c0_g1_i2:21-1778(-)
MGRADGSILCVAILLLGRLSEGQLGTCSSDYTIAMNGTAVFSIAAATRTCICPAYMASGGASVFHGGIGKPGLTTTFNGPVGVAGCVSVQGSIRAASVVVNGSAGVSVLGGPLTVAGNASIGGLLSVGGGAVIDGSTGLSVTGTATIGGGLSVAADLGIAGGLAVGGALTSSGPLLVNANLTVGGVATVSGGLLMPPGAAIDTAYGSSTRSGLAGKIIYEGSAGNGFLHIHGAGNVTGSREVRLWDTAQADSVRLTGTYTPGLQAEYFDIPRPYEPQTGVLFRYPAYCTQVDSSINIQNNAFCIKSFSSYFSIRWSGFIMSTVSSIVQLWLSGTNNPRMFLSSVSPFGMGSLAPDSTVMEQSITTFLSAGRYYPIRFEFFQQSGPYEIHFEAKFGSGPRLPVNASNLFSAMSVNIVGGEIKSAGDVTISGTARFPNGIGTTNTITVVHGRRGFSHGSTTEAPHPRTPCPNGWSEAGGFCWTFLAQLNSSWQGVSWSAAQQYCSQAASTVCNVGQLMEANLVTICTAHSCWTNSLCANGQGGMYVGNAPVNLTIGIDQAPWGCYDDNFVAVSGGPMTMCCMNRLFV